MSPPPSRAAAPRPSNVITASSAKLRSILQQTELTAQTLADQDRAALVLMPVPRTGPLGETDEATRRHIQQMISTLLRVERLRVAVLATPGFQFRSGYTCTMDLNAPMIGAAQINPAVLPGAFGVAARSLVRWMGAQGWASTPLEARLQVGLVALGERPEDVALRLEALARKLVVQLGRRPALATAVHRLLLARRALPRSEIAAVSGVEPHWQPLLESCIGYGDDEIRVSEVIRQVLLDALEASPTTSGGASALENAHASLADYHESLDGASSLIGLERTQAINWMEKVHHLALGGSACAERWDRQQLAGREQLWERARHLSRNLHQFAVAAQLYQSCLDAFGDDPYSQHYLAYNLERSGGSISAVRSGYGAAAAAEPENPWWQQRWIRFLIAHGTLAEAHTAWQQALRAIDPDGSRLRRSPWLALNLHCWVARRWLALGRLEEARVVLSEVPAQWLQEAPLQELLELLAVQEQELVLGESVYPESTPLSARWKEPQNLRPMRAGKPLVWWAPGRVLEALPGSVTVALAPTSEEAQQLTFEASRWQEMADEPAEDAQGFFEIGRYEGGEHVVRPMPDAIRKTSLDFEEAELRARVGR